MPPLKDICKQQIEAFLHEDTVLDVLISATLFNSWELKQKCYAIQLAIISFLCASFTLPFPRIRFLDVGYKLLM